MEIDRYICNKFNSIFECLKKIDDNKKDFLIVLEDKKVIGIVTEGDLRRQLLNRVSIDSIIKFNNNYKYINKCDTILEVIDKFKDDKVTFLPVLGSEKSLINLITKKQFHSMLLENIKFDINYNFESIDENELNHEVYDRPWGFYKSTILISKAQSKVITVFPKGELSLQEHKKREEHWVVISGEGKVTLGESVLDCYPGKYIFIPKGCKHKIVNISNTKDLIFIEVQLGEYFGEDDIIRYSDIYGRSE